MRAAAIDRGRALAVFADGTPHSARDLAVSVNVSVRTAAWFMAAAERRGWLRRVAPKRFVRYPDFGLFEVAE